MTTLAAPKLGTLAAKINETHAAAVAAAQASIENARRCGELLLKAKAAVGHGGFSDWLAEHCNVGERQSRRYMLLARGWEHLPKTDTMSDLTMAAAVKLIRHARGEEPTKPVRSLAPLFSSVTDRWATPADVYAALDEEFRFDFDPCPLDGEADGLAPACVWRGRRVYINAPYGAGINRWLERASEAELAVYLLPARTDTRWFHELVLPRASEIRFLRGRLRFGGAKSAAPFPSMVVIFHEGCGGWKTRVNGQDKTGGSPLPSSSA